jgi:hypothetical protein
MPVTFNERLIAYLTLISGLSISAVAVYYSVVGLTAIFAAAVVPIIIMGATLEISKLVATVWLKQNWKIAPWSVKAYLMIAIFVLMIITSMGIFGFLSKAHSDQNLVSGDVLAKLSIYDEKIKTSKENIEVKRKELKQLDEAVDQVMARSTDEKGADKAVAIRKSQQRDRNRIAKEIETEQTNIGNLNNEAAPIRAEVRKVEAEVGPLKYIASFVYGDTDPTILEKSVTWVIITLIVVFDPLAVILLLASQISFQNFREREDPNERELQEFADAFNEAFNEPEKYVADVTMPEPVPMWTMNTTTNYEPDDGPLTDEQIEQIKKTVDPSPAGWMFEKSSILPEKSVVEQHAYLNKPFVHFENLKPMVQQVEKHEEPEVLEPAPIPEAPKVKMLASGDYVEIDGQRYSKRSLPTGYVQNEEQIESGKWQEINKSIQITEQEYLQKAKERKNEI